MKEQLGEDFFKELYSGFAMPLCKLDCGSKCGPHNDYGVPLCCDIHQVVPTAFNQEWKYLEENSDLWMPWTSSGELSQELEEELQEGQILLECKGYQECQRDFRTLTCRAFPFYPYLNSKSEFIGMSYYPEYRFGCWIISNLEVVSQLYKEAFQRTFQHLFKVYPEFHQNLVSYCSYIREKAADEIEQIIVLTFSGEVSAIDPRTEVGKKVEFKELKPYGPYEITRELRFSED